MGEIRKRGYLYYAVFNIVRFSPSLWQNRKCRLSTSVVYSNGISTIRFVKRLVKKAKAGEPWAVRELLDRLIGKPVAPLDIDLTGGDARSVVDFAIMVRQARGLATDGDDGQNS